MAEAGWASDVSARTRREEGAGRPAESGTGPGGGYWTPVPALNASNDVVEFGRGGDDGRGEEGCDVGPLKFVTVVLQRLEFANLFGLPSQVPDYYKGNDPL